MALGIVNEQDLLGIANGIRATNGGVSTYTPSQMPAAVNELTKKVMLRYFAALQNEYGTFNVSTYPFYGFTFPSGNPDGWIDPDFLNSFPNKSLLVAIFAYSNIVKVPYLNNPNSDFDASDMFRECASLVSVGQMNQNLDNYTSISGMFYNCSNLAPGYMSLSSNTITSAHDAFVFTKINVLELSFSILQNAERMCRGMSQLTRFSLGTQAGTLTSTNSMFENCGALASVSLFDTSNVTSANLMFNGCSALTSIPAYNFNSLSSGSDMFVGCSNILECHCINIGCDIDFSSFSNSMTAAAITELFTNLKDVTANPKTVTVKEWPALTTSMLDIAANKGWNIDGLHLASPHISLNGSIISWNSVNPNASYELYVNSVQTATGIQGTSIDLTNYISASGSYDIQIKATATYYQEALSNTVVFEIQSSDPIYGVRGLYHPLPNLTRTDDAVNMNYTIDSSTGEISSDFDTVFPWNESTVETIDGNKFLHLPDMWFRIGTDSSNRITDVAVSKSQGSTGNWYKVDSFYYGCYGGYIDSNDGVLWSKSGEVRSSGWDRDSFRSAAISNNVNPGEFEYFQLDLYHHTVMQFLWLIEWATKDSSVIMTGNVHYDTSISASPCQTGGTDNLTTPSGFDPSTKQMRYHYIEDFIGNYLEFIDGCVGDGSSYYVTDDPADFDEGYADMTALSYPYPSNASVSDRCISALGWDDNNPFLVQPIEQIGIDYTVYFCDSNPASNDVVYATGAAYNSSSENSGLFALFHFSRSDTSMNLGGRLLYKPTLA